MERAEFTKWALDDIFQTAAFVMRCDANLARRQALIDQAVRAAVHPAFLRHNYKGYPEELAEVAAADIRAEFRRLQSKQKAKQ